MSYTSVFTSSQSQRRWRKHMEHNYISIHRIRPCVFQVPDNLRETKPEAYTPQLVGLGPYHHFRAELQHMEILKRAAVLDYLKIVDIKYFIDDDDDGISDGFKLKIESLSQLVAESPDEFEPTIRSCYDRYLDLDKRTLAWVVIVDGFFLMHFIGQLLGPEEEKQKIYSNIGALAADVLMLENQIPIILIKKMRTFREEAFNCASDIELFNKFKRFCREQSPLQLTTNAGLIDEAFDQSNHMLQFLYQMIVKTKRPAAHCNQEDISQDNENRPPLGSRLGGLALEAASQGREIFVQAIEEFNSALSDAKSAGIKVPGNIERVANILRNLQKTLHLNHKKDYLGDQIDIPSASRLNAILKMTFKPLPDCCGIDNIDLNPEKKILYLPAITLRANSEVILRNLVAYEATSKMGSTQMRDYVDLMCGIVKSEKDVKLLKKAGIIRGEFPDEEIVRMCNGIMKSDEKSDEKSKVHSTVKEVNNQFNNVGIVKVSRSTVKCFAGCLKFFKPLFPLFVLLFLIFQSACNIFDCRIRSYRGLSLPNLHSRELDSEARLLLPRKVYPY